MRSNKRGYLLQSSHCQGCPNKNQIREIADNLVRLIESARDSPKRKKVKFKRLGRGFTISARKFCSDLRIDLKRDGWFSPASTLYVNVSGINEVSDSADLIERADACFNYSEILKEAKKEWNYEDIT